MKIQTILAASAAAIAVVSSPVFAQTTATGEADPSGCRAASSAPTSAREKANARQARRAEGTQVARSDTPGDDQPCSAGQASTDSKQARKAAATKRRSEASTALKKGEIQSGEK
jgi:hypothetical protein